MTGKRDTELLERLRDAVGRRHVLTSARETARYRQGYRTGSGPALAVVQPGSLVELWKVAQACVGGCFDFKVTGLSAGAQATVFLLPLSTPIPKGTVAYRTYKGTSWVNFDSSTGDSIASAPGSSSSCPAASSSQYVNGLQAGDSCVRLTITDGGPNDADGVANGVIIDPGGVATSGEKILTAKVGDGCSMSTAPVDPTERADWWLVASFLGALAWLRSRRKNHEV